MDRKTFAAILSRYLSGEASPTESRVVEHWYALIEEQPRSLQPQELEELENRLWTKLERSAGIQAEYVDDKLWWKGSRRMYQYLVAAGVALLLLFGYYRYMPMSGLGRLEEGFVAVTNEEDSELLVTLEDRSIVRLAPKAQLRYPEHFEETQRVVTLSGEAFFEVSENPNRPFLVNAGKITTKVLGTSFSVKAPKGKSNVEVSVRTGKVSVFEKAKSDLAESNRVNNGVILTPNHQVTFIADQEVFVTKLVDNPLPLEGHAPFLFDDSPLSEVLRKMEQAYAIDIELEQSRLGTCPLTANLSNKGLYAQLDLLCAAIQGSYELKGTTILINGKGCD